VAAAKKGRRSPRSQGYPGRALAVILIGIVFGDGGDIRIKTNIGPPFVKELNGFVSGSRRAVADSGIQRLEPFAVIFEENFI